MKIVKVTNGCCHDYLSRVLVVFSKPLDTYVSLKKLL